MTTAPRLSANFSLLPRREEADWLVDRRKIATMGGLKSGTRFRDFLNPVANLTDPEVVRQARLISGFGWLGTFFGITYAAFYLLIGHRWGALIIILCSSCFAMVPLSMRSKKSVRPAGHILVLTLILGFSALCFVEGGLRGHAIAWLASVPLCALLLLGQTAAIGWAVMAFLAAGVVAILDLAGVKLPTEYDLKWEPVVSATGYLGLIVFMFMLGLIFETSRRRAFLKMEQAVAELATANERLVHLNNEKNEFLQIAAHDLKNPLTVVLGSAELAGLVKDQDQIDKLLANICAAAARMSRLISDLLDVNAIEQGAFTSVVLPCNVGELVEQSVKNNQSAAARKAIKINVGASAGLWARACPAAAVQILDNLISNALKYSPPNTVVHIHTLPETNFALVAVRDEGPGISESDQKKLFQKYTRLTARPTGGESSTGLGLAIVKRLAEAMAGSIHCHSTPGAGSTFTLRLPKCEPPAPGSAIGTAAAANSPIRAAVSVPPSPFPGRN
jgi:signal transduction histidine kinase